MIIKGNAAGLFASAVLLAGTALSMPAMAQSEDRTITVVLQSEPDTLDGCQAARNRTGTVIMDNVVETLVRRDAGTGELTPSLATSWEQVDEDTWRFHLRENVTFHDGAAWDAAAAVTSLERAMSETIACETRLKILSGIKITATAVDPLTLEVSADRPVPILPVQMASVPFTSPNTPDELVTNPVGTGPYSFEIWEAGQQILLSRYEDYWGEKPEIEAATYIWRAESSVRAAMVALGEADLTPAIAAQDATDPERDKSYLNSETTYLRIDTLTPPLDDVRVRLALNYAFDRHAVLATMMPPGTIHATQIVVPAIPGHNPALDDEVFPYDPDKAMELLAEAKADGVPVDIEIVLQTRPAVFPNALDVAQAMVAMYQAVGLNVRLEPIDEVKTVEVANRPFAEGRQPALLQESSDNNQGDPVLQAAFKYGCEGSQSQHCSEAVDALIADASATPAGDERIQKWQEMFRVLFEDDIPAVWQYHMVAFARVGDRIDFAPTLATNSAVPLAEISFK